MWHISVEKTLIKQQALDFLAFPSTPGMADQNFDTPSRPLEVLAFIQNFDWTSWRRKGFWFDSIALDRKDHAVPMLPKPTQKANQVLLGAQKNQKSFLLQDLKLLWKLASLAVVMSYQNSDLPSRG